MSTEILRVKHISLPVNHEHYSKLIIG